MSIDYQETKQRLIKGIPYEEYQRQYQRERKRKSNQFYLTPTISMRFRTYYHEYLTLAQQEGIPIVDFQSFIIQFAEIGFLNWRSKTKGK